MYTVLFQQNVDSLQNDKWRSMWGRFVHMVLQALAIFQTITFEAFAGSIIIYLYVCIY